MSISGFSWLHLAVFALLVFLGFWFQTKRWLTTRIVLSVLAIAASGFITFAKDILGRWDLVVLFGTIIPLVVNLPKKATKNKKAVD